MKTASLPGIPFRVLRVLLAVGLWFQADPGRAGNADAPAVVEGKTNMAGGAGVRQPAVAGLFYPREREMLARTVDELLSAAPKVPVEGLRALICPHAGYSYSGVTAARAYQAIQGKRYRTVVVMGPSHYAAFKGIAVTRADAYRTPLGLVAVSPLATRIAETPPFLLEPRCLVQRPGWAGQSSRGIPPAGQETPEAWEHSLEVQLPFLQRALGDFQLVPLICGEVDPLKAARILARHTDSNTLLIASSDLSHYHSYEEGRALDERCVRSICDLDIASMENQEACGKTPILALMHLARDQGWKVRRLDYRNSGDTGGDKRGVVGYAAVAFYAPSSGKWTDAEKKQLLGLARRSVERGVRGKAADQEKGEDWPEVFRQPKGCFVTLTLQGRLRGCIGHIFPQLPLGEAIRGNARSAALEDPRFPPVNESELDQLHIEISILTPPMRLEYSSAEDLLDRLRPGVDGVVMKMGERGATYLPQVWEQIPEKVDFLNHLAEKAGCERTAWRQPGTEIWVYQADIIQ
ncbi:MAG TPA: AmmeMemoRadiSam system protein B [Candidatus Paceibacterota bacterium]|nr:AmmeMemoRadiSam system protein B [Candidatus Paceibacterota bacterium]